MFRSVYLKLRHVYNSISKFYASIIVEYPLATIVCYILLILSFSFGLFQTQVTYDNERLTILRDSQALSETQKLNKLFELNQYERFFQFRLLDLGYYVEIIVKIKDETQNFINNTYLNEYNKLYDEILSIQLSDDSNGTNETKSNITYIKDLCPKRMNLCAIEGGLLREEIFQKNCSIIKFSMKNMTLLKNISTRI